MLNKIALVSFVSTLAIACSACFQGGDAIAAQSAVASNPGSTEMGQDTADPVATSRHAASIRLSGKTIVVDGTGATAVAARVTITRAGTYSISGTLDNGQIVVDTTDKELVKLVLNNVSIANTDGAPVHIRKAEQVELQLADGSVNRVTDSARRAMPGTDADEINAAIFSKEDLVISGKGVLTVQGNFKHGINSKDSLRISGGTLTVQANNDGIKARDSLRVSAGVITVRAAGDGLQAYNDEDASKGRVTIAGGTLDITAGADGIQAETSLLMTGGAVSVLSGGGSTGAGRGGYAVASQATASNKGLKAGVALAIKGGTLKVDAADDALHANDALTIEGGDIQLVSADDAIRANSSVHINGGKVRITRSYEGMESKVIVMNGGEVRLVSSDDGINITDDSGEAAYFGRPRGGAEFSRGSLYFAMHGGFLSVDSGGDGLDANGSVEMSGGRMLVNGPVQRMNSALDYDGGFKMTGGFLVAAGSSGMAQAPGTASTQYAALVNISTQAAGTPVHVAAEDGTALFTFVPSKDYQSVAMSSPEFKLGKTYVVYTGGRASGTATDGLYEGGSYADGVEVARFTISSVVSYVSSAGGRGAWGGMGGMGGL